VVRKLGIIPAAGKADRFGGVLKEMLPIAEGTTPLRRTVNIMKQAGCDVILVITNKDKLQMHMQHLEKENVFYVIQSGGKDIWGAIMESLPLHGERNLFAMPDTYYPPNVFDDFFCADFNLGCFETEVPERYGVVLGNRIANKQNLEPGRYKAWGVLGWTGAVAEHWQKNIKLIETYTHALNMAMEGFDHHIKPMNFYYDFAAFEDYQKFIKAN